MTPIRYTGDFMTDAQQPPNELKQGGPALPQTCAWCNMPKREDCSRFGTIGETENSYGVNCPNKIEYSRLDAIRRECVRLTDLWPIPPRYELARLAPPPRIPGLHDPYALASQYLQDVEQKIESKLNPSNLLIHGKYGVGKSRLAAAIAHEAIARPIPTIYVSEVELLRRLRAQFDDDEGGESILQSVMDCKLLIIDDFAKSIPTPWVSQTTWEIIDYRYNNMLATVITTNKSPEHLPEGDLWEALLDRLREDAMTIKIECERSLRNARTDE